MEGAALLLLWREGEVGDGSQTRRRSRRGGRSPPTRRKAGGLRPDAVPCRGQEQERGSARRRTGKKKAAAPRRAAVGRSVDLVFGRGKRGAEGFEGTFRQVEGMGGIGQQ